MKLRKYLIHTLVIAFCGPFSLSAYAAFIAMEVEPYRLINAHFTVYAHISKNERFSSLDILRIQGDTAQTVKSFKLSALKDKDPRSDEYEWHILTFLPLGEYKLALGGGKTLVATGSSYDTRDFLPALAARAQAQADKPSEPNVPVLIFTRNDGIPEDAIAGKIKALAPLGAQANPKPVFRWQAENASKNAEYYLYVFKDSNVVWKTMTKGTEMQYDGSALKRGKFYQWVLGTEKDGKVWVMDGFSSFKLK